MEMQIEKVGMLRLQNNPRNQEFKLNVDWDIEYIHKTSYNLKYICNLKSLEEFPLTLRIEGNLNLDDSNEFNEEEFSKIIIDKSLKILLEMLNITKDCRFEIQSNGEFIKIKLNRTI